MAEFEPGWNEPLELGGMGLPEEVPRLGGSPEEPELKDYPIEFKHFSTMDPEFLELGPIPLGSVLTMTWSESGHPTPGLVAVLVVGADYQENGVWLDVRLLGADAEWAKKKSISIFSKRKLPIHLCVDPERHRCEETAAHHITEFGFWPPGIKFKAAYVERSEMTMMNKYLQELDDPEKTKEKEVVEGSTPERLAALRQKLLKAKSKGTGQSPFVSFQTGAPRVSILKRPHSSPAKIKPEADAVVHGQLRQRCLSEVSEKEQETSRDRSSPLCCSGATAASGQESRSSIGVSFQQQEEEKEEETEKEKEKGQFKWFLVFLQWKQQRRSEATFAKEGGTKTWQRPEDVDGSCPALPLRSKFGSFRRGGSGFIGYKYRPGPKLLPDLSSSSAHKPSKRREGTFLIGIGLGPTSTRSDRESSRLDGSSGDCSVGGQLGHGKVARGKSPRGQGRRQCRSVAGCKKTSTHHRQSFRERFIRSWRRSLLGSWKLRCIPLVRWWCRPRPRQRKERQKRKRKKQKGQSRKERLGSQLVGRLPAEGGRRQGSSQEGGLVQVMEVDGVTFDHPDSGEIEGLIENARVAAAAALKKVKGGPQDSTSTSTCGLSGYGASSDRVPVVPAETLVSDEVSWQEALVNSPDLAQFGGRLAWGMSRGFCYNGFDFLKHHVKPIATSVASKSTSCLFPLPVDFSGMIATQWPLGDFSRESCVDSWINLIAAALNRLHGSTGPYPRSRHGKSVKKCLETLRNRVERFLEQPLEGAVNHSQVWSDVCSKRVSYDGEEVGLAHPLTVAQVFKSLPPVGHGGSIDVIPLLQGRTKFLMEHPSQVLLQGPKQRGFKNKAKVHICPGEEVSLFRLLFERGVIDFVKEDEVHSDEGGPYLSGLFGVAKPGKFTEDNKPILRLIMNLIPINRTLGVILGDIAELPSASAWQQLVLVEGDTISISQADMASAFYLFRIPPAWQKYLCFNFKLSRQQAGLSGQGYVYPACRVLPMGWSSSVGVMQMASRELI